MVRSTVLALGAALVWAGLSSPAAFAASAAAEAYGTLPIVQDMALSPDGSRLAVLRNQGEERQVALVDLAQSRTLEVIALGDVKVRDLAWADDRFVLIWASETRNMRAFAESDVEFGAAFALDTQTNKNRQLLIDYRGLGVNSSLGNVLSVVEGSGSVLLSAYVFTTPNPRDFRQEPAVLKVPLDKGGAEIVLRAPSENPIWFYADETGAVRVRLEHDPVVDTWVIRGGENGAGDAVWTRRDTPVLDEEIYGLSDAADGLIIGQTDAAGFRVAAPLSLADGTVGAPVVSSPTNDVVAPIRDPRDRSVVGAVIADVAGPRFRFFDPALQAVVERVSDGFAGAVARPISWSEDGNAWIFQVAGGDAAPTFYLYDRATDGVRFIADAYAGIPPEAVAPVRAVRYTARDGLEITAVVTTPPGAPATGPLPLVVLPHGGPESHDSVGWDWMAQAFANQGYLVLQPNFRGSSGFGAAFTRKGYGEWGRAIQDDITDGRAHLVAQGLADPERVCIVGWSFGGYAALAGAAFTPELYRCAIAGAPVTDLSRMLAAERVANGRNSWIVDYWEEAMKGPDGATRLRDASPANFADRVQAPVLLLHGTDDTTVEIEQSKIMRSALQRADKDVKLVELRGEDHWLSNTKTRVQALDEMLGFLEAHLGR